MGELNPEGSPFDRVVFRTFRPIENAQVLFDKIALAKPLPAQASSGPTPIPAAAGGKPARARIACDGKAIPISPYIYGIAGSDKDIARLPATARRWGGNPTSRYNPDGNFWNSASDWFFENHQAPSYTDFLNDNGAHGAKSAITIPMLGWIAKDGASFSFPVSVFGPQARTDQWHSDAGNGVNQAGKDIAPGPPSRTSAEAPPAWAERWITAIRAADAGKSNVYEYILDNEPMLWHATHRDVHPTPVGYDELVDRTIQYGGAIRKADPNAVIAGPAEWGWSGYFYSAKDTAPGGGYADRRAHGDVPLVEWYLRRLREHEQKTGTRVLDVLDLHYYPQGNNVYAGGAGGSDRATQLLRLRSTRSLWDDTYLDESWINDKVRLLPRMKEWVDRNYPGRGISVGEWNFGGEKDVTGALATAEALGRFAQFGVTSAFYWGAPPADSPSVVGFFAYRNFDGKGGRFLDNFVPTTTADTGSFFASRDAEGKHLVIVAINMAPDTPLAAELDVASCGAVSAQQAYSYVSGAGGLTVATPAPPASPTVVARVLPPWSITVFDLRLR
jgi:hypothetical protein